MPSEALFTSPHAECEEPHLWTAPDDSGSEVEVSQALSALVRLVKPRVVVETGTYHGATTVLLAAAVKSNGRGHVYALELDEEAAAVARQRITEEGLDGWATIVHGDSLEWTPSGPIDFAFLDAGAGWHRVDEFRRLWGSMHRGSVVCVHDTARKNVMPRLGLRTLELQGMLSPVWVRSPRGLLIGQPRFPNPARRLAGWPFRISIRLYIGVRSRLGGLRRSVGLLQR